MADFTGYNGGPESTRWRTAAEAIEKLAEAKSLSKPPDGVLTAEEVEVAVALSSVFDGSTQCGGEDAERVVSGLEDVLPASKTLGFLKDADVKGDDWKNYSWWDDVKSGKGALPADNTAVFHYHPIALILQLA